MPGFFPPDLSFQTIAIALAVFFAIKAFVKGVLRQVWGMVCLAFGVIAGYFIFRNGNDWLGAVIEHPGGDTVLAASALGGGAVWIGGQGIVRKVYKSLSGSSSDPTLTGRLAGAVASLVPTAFLLWVLATLLRLTGTLTGMSHLDNAVRAGDGAPAGEPGLMARLHRQLDQGRFGELLRKTDPFTTEAGRRLASLLVLYNDADAWARLQQLQPEIASLLANEKVQRVLNDKEVRKAAAFSEHAALLLEPDVRKAAADPEVARQLLFLDIQETAQNVLYERAPDAGADDNAGTRDDSGGRFLRRGRLQ